MRLRNIIITTLIVAAVAATIFTVISIQLPRNVVGRSISVQTNIGIKDSYLRVVAVNSAGYPLGGAVYLVSPSPYDNSKSYIIKTNKSNTLDSTPGITFVSGLKPGTYSLSAHEAPAGYNLDSKPKLIYLTSKHTTTSAFVFSHSNSTGTSNVTQQARDVSYNVKFICGSVSGNDGPLRPGHYNTDISLFNNQGSTVPFLWNAVSNDGKSSSSILKTLQPGTSSGIACRELLQLFGIQNITSNLVEGFVVIRPQTSVGGLASFSGSSATVSAHPPSQNQLNPLTVQVFYSANALLTLPHNVAMDKILFSILNDTSSKVPASLLGKKLDITIQSQSNQITDPEAEVRDMLASKYKLSPEDLTHLKVQIISVGLGVTSMIDDHAISSFQVMPQATP
jgi:prealbumin domain-containing protein